MRLTRVFVLAASTCLAACGGSLVRPALLPAKPAGDALLVLPGFGYSHSGEQVFRSLASSMAREGIDLYVADYVTRSGLSTSRAKLERFIRDSHLERYSRLHVFAFIAGAWTLNPLLDRHELPNLATVVYDRSPFQERAPRIAADRMRLLAWMRYGSTVFDVANTAYAPLTAPDLKIALLVESTPTAFVRRHERAARAYGPFAFECAAFGQRYDDCAYLPMNHDEFYMRFADVWPEVLAFIRHGRFTAEANRIPPTGDPLALDGGQP